MLANLSEATARGGKVVPVPLMRVKPLYEVKNTRFWGFGWAIYGPEKTCPSGMQSRDQLGDT